MEKRNTHPLWPMLLLAAAVGTAAFGLIHGFAVLDPTRDNWILYLYGEDLAQHYAGWCAFQKSAWHFPLGLADQMAYGTYITYTDSIPLVAIVVKFVLQLAGYTGTFQYFGLYTLLCYVLQAFAAGLLARRKTDSLPLQGLAMVLFCFTPVLLDRALRHTALGSQWLVLLAIWALLRCRDGGYRRYPWLFYLLAVLAITIHPYFIPMTMIFALIAVVEAVFHRKKLAAAAQFLGLFAGNLAVCALTGWSIGALNNSFKILRAGYGSYAMNLNGPVNPTSEAGYPWSAFLPHLPVPDQNGDGFTYLGVGVLLLAAGCLVALAVRRRLAPFLRKNAFYLLAMLGMTLFAVSNTVMLNDRQLFTVPLPERVLYLCGIFRASSRMFYPVIYSVMAGGVNMVCGAFAAQRRQAAGPGGLHSAARRKACALAAALAVVTAVQLWDLHGAVAGLHAYMAERLRTVSLLDDAALQQKLAGYRVLAWDPDHEGGDLRAMVVCAAKNGMQSLYSVANTGLYPYVRANEENAQKWSDLQQGQTAPDTVYVTLDATAAQEAAACNPAAELWQVQPFYLLFPPQA